MSLKLLDKLKDKALSSSIAADNAMVRVSDKFSGEKMAKWGRDTYSKLNGETAPANEGIFKKIARNATKYTAMTAMAYGLADQSGKDQEHALKAIGEKDKALATKCDVGIIYPICTALQVSAADSAGVFDTFEGTTAFLANAVLSLGINSYRAKKAFVDGEPTSAVCVQTIPARLAYNAPKIMKTIKEKGLAGATKYAATKVAEIANREIAQPLHETTENLSSKLYESLQDTKVEFDAAVPIMTPRFEDSLKF